MGYHSSVDIASINARLAPLDEEVKAVCFDADKVASSSSAVITLHTARLGEKLNLKETIAAGGSGCASW